MQQNPVRSKSAELIRHKLFHPCKENDEIVRMSEEFADLWPAWVRHGNLEGDVNGWLRKLNLSHTGFWRGPGSGLPPYFAINAVLNRLDDGRLVFWDVLPGGIAERLGLHPVTCSSESMARTLPEPSRGSASGALTRLLFPAKMRRRQLPFPFRVWVRRTGLRWLKRSP